MQTPFVVPKIEPNGFALAGLVVGLARDDRHRFSKLPVESIYLLEGFGVEGDAHAGVYTRHRYQARRQPRLPNLRQVHLIPAELFASLREAGYALQPAALGENVSTSGLNLERFPLGTVLEMGPEASVELTGLRTPCMLINRFRAGLKREMVNHESDGPRFRSGVMGIVRIGGRLAVGDLISVRLPSRPWTDLPAL
jgi:MOSC domain